ncbi:hypothetical protein Drorol1_Dr00013620 [Drosera rotundifolia]
MQNPAQPTLRIQNSFFSFLDKPCSNPKALETHGACVLTHTSSLSIFGFHFSSLSDQTRHHCGGSQSPLNPSHSSSLSRSEWSEASEFEVLFWSVNGFKTNCSLVDFNLRVGFDFYLVREFVKELSSFVCVLRAWLFGFRRCCSGFMCKVVRRMPGVSSVSICVLIRRVHTCFSKQSVYIYTHRLKIADNGFGYQLDEDVYFCVDGFPDFGLLSGRKLEDNRLGERVAVDSRKGNPAEFTLWKTAKEGKYPVGHRFCIHIYP